MNLLSICIPTFNRPVELENCLNSILIAHQNYKKLKFDVCISDNFSKNDTLKIIKKFSKKFENENLIKFNKNKENIGGCLNILKSVSLSSSKYVWVIGDDDLILPDAFRILDELLKKNYDFYFVNSFNLNKSFTNKFEKPFNTKLLPEKMKKFSEIQMSQELKFFELINPKISFDFLLAIYLSVFKRQKWNQNINEEDSLKVKKIKSKDWISSFENTCLHIKIFTKAFKRSKVFINKDPLSVNLSGTRDWSDNYYFLEIVRLPEMLDFYRQNGMNFFNYIKCKNFALRNFINYFGKIYFNRNNPDFGWHLIDIKKHILKNMFYPNALFSVFRFLIRKFIFIFKKEKSYIS